MADPYWTATVSIHDQIPDAVLDLHSDEGYFVGVCEITCGRGFLARSILNLSGFPKSGNAVPVSLRTEHLGHAVIWNRNFGGHKTRSVVTAGSDHTSVCEKFGPFTVIMTPTLDASRIALPLTGFRVLGIPLPQAFWPRSETFEGTDNQGRYTFDVAAYAPVIGLLIRYQGVLTRQDN